MARWLARSNAISAGGGSDGVASSSTAPRTCPAVKPRWRGCKKSRRFILSSNRRGRVAGQERPTLLRGKEAKGPRIRGSVGPVCNDGQRCGVLFRRDARLRAAGLQLRLLLLERLV